MDLSLRDKLALDRTRLANQRTFMAYIRTSFYLVIVALAILEFNEFAAFYNWVWFLLAAAAIVLLIGFYTFYKVKRRIRNLYS